MVALHTAVNLRKGNPPTPPIERCLKQALFKRRDQDTAISRILKHTGIPGNGKARQKSGIGVHTRGDSEVRKDCNRGRY